MNKKRIIFPIIVLFVVLAGIFLTKAFINPSGRGVTAASGAAYTASGSAAGAASGQAASPSAAVPTIAPDTSASPQATTSPEQTPAPDETPAPTSTPSVMEFSFSASGDNLIHSCLYEQAAARGRSNGKKYDFSYCYKKVADFFKEQDLNWINQETLVNSGYSPSGYPTFSTPIQVVKDLRNIGFTVFNTSSNHSYDKLSGGLVASMEFWNKMSNKREGKDAYQVGIVKRSKPLPQLIRNINGIRVGFLSYTYGTNGISIDSSSKYRIVYLSERDRIKKQVRALRKKADVVMVSCHWGVENSHSVTEEQKKLAKDLVGWGADLIIGTHPHVLQNCARISSNGRKGFCAYSLGNFISGQVQTNQILGGTLTCTVRVNKKTGKVTIKAPKLKPVVTIYGENRSGIHVKWLEDYDSDDVARQSSHISKSAFINLAEKVVSKKYLEIH